MPKFYRYIEIDGRRCSLEGRGDSEPEATRDALIQFKKLHGGTRRSCDRALQGHKIVDRQGHPRT